MMGCRRGRDGLTCCKIRFSVVTKCHSTIIFDKTLFIKPTSSNLFALYTLSFRFLSVLRSQKQNWFDHKSLALFRGEVQQLPVHC